MAIDDNEHRDALVALVPELVARLRQLTRLHLEHQAVIVAIAAYLREQPACDVERLATLIEAQRAALKLSPRPADLDETLQALLRDFEGPPQ